MFKHGASQFEQELITIHPGEYYATGEDTIISTVLGSCISVALHDPERRCGGLNHFMLPGESGGADIVRNPNAKYGMYAMEMLINDLFKLGSRKRALEAKVFGGGAVLKLAGGASSRVPESNIAFAFEYLAKEGIPVLASDVGGSEPRKIFLFARTGKVLLKRIAPSLADLAEREEERYLRKLRESKDEGSIILFEGEEGP